MIGIVNVTEKIFPGRYGKGEQTYRVQINDKVICYFLHNYEDGLAECLRRAAWQVEKENEHK